MFFFLTTGDYCLRERFPEAEDRLDIFLLAAPSTPARVRLRRLWHRMRPVVLARWKAEGRAGVPWAAEEFDIDGG